MAHRGSRGIALPFLDHALEGGEGSASCPSCSLPLGKTRYPLYRRLGGSQGQSGQVQKISPPLGFCPWTVQPVASHYTDYAIQPIATMKAVNINSLLYSILIYHHLQYTTTNCSEEWHCIGI